MIRSNLHTHTTFSDGKNTPEETVQAALACGFLSLGFSDHAHSPLDPVCAMPIGRFSKYCLEIQRLKQKYQGQIQLYAGIENDALNPQPTDSLDYVIGSVHYIRLDQWGTTMCVDSSVREFKQGIDFFKGDVKRVVALYFATMIHMLKTQNLDIVGHFDLLTKFNRDGKLFDVTADWYRDLALEAVEAVKDSGHIVEVNTGGMSRGYMDHPYPDNWLLTQFQTRHIPMAISSDCHQIDTLHFQFEETAALLVSLGFTETWQLLDGAFCAVKL